MVEVQHLARDPRERDRRLHCIALMLARGTRLELLPAGEMRLRAGDRLLYCGRQSAQTRMAWTLQNLHALDYVLIGGSSPQGALWRLFRRRANGAS